MEKKGSETGEEEDRKGPWGERDIRILEKGLGGGRKRGVERERENGEREKVARWKVGQKVLERNRDR